MENLKTLRGLLACIAILESTSTNTVNATCQDQQACLKYKFPLICEEKANEWFLKNCPKTCIACPTDKLSNMYVDNSTVKFISYKSRIQEERNVTDVNKGVNAPCQDQQDCAKFTFPLLCEGSSKVYYLKNCPKSCNACPADHLSKTYIDSRTVTLISSKSTKRDGRNVTDVNKAPEQPEQTTGTTRILSATVGAATCLDKAECSNYRIPLDCTWNSWLRQNCQASCNTCPRGTSKTTRTRTQKVSSQPRRTTASQRDASVTASSHPQLTVATTWIPSPAATSPAKSRNLSVQVHDDVSQDFPESASHLPSPHQNVIIAVVIIAVIILIVFTAGVVIFKKRRDKSSGKNPLQPTHEETWSSDGQVVFTSVSEETVLFSPGQRDQSSDQNHAIDINPPKLVTEETEVRDTCRVSVNKDGLVYSILDFKDFQPKDFVPPSPTERIEYATIDFGGAISCSKNTRD